MFKIAETSKITNRKASIYRKSIETDISLDLNLDSFEDGLKIYTGCGFLNHMLTLFAFHSGYSLCISASGDADVDFHHLGEDLGMCLGKAVAQALGDKRGIHRYANISLPMDETLVNIAIDISGRGFLVFNVPFERDKVGEMDTEVVEEFFHAFVRTSGITLHINMMYGKNTHHIIEAIFKGFGRVLKEATKIENYNNAVPSSKGIIDNSN